MRLVLGAAVVALTLGATTTGNRMPTATCDDATEIPNEPAPPPDTLVLGRVRMPRADDVLQLAPPAYRGASRFAKRGLSVTAGAAFVLEVPRRYRGVYGLAFGSGTGRLGAHAVHVRPCAAYVKPWTSWAGGYVARKPVCVWLVVRADGRAARVPLNIGRRCARIAR